MSGEVDEPRDHESVYGDGPGELGVPVDPPASSDTSFEVELDEEPLRRHEPLYVDVVSRDEPERRPILPAKYMPQNIKTTTKRFAGRQAYRAGYHGLRLPLLYAPLGTFWAVVGLGRLVGRLIYWTFDMHARPLQHAAVRREDVDEWLKIVRQRSAHAGRRLFVVGLLALLAAIGVGLFAWLAPTWVQALVILCAIPGLAHIGRPDNRPIIRSAVVAPQYRKLNSDIVLRAYYAAKLGDPDKPDQKVDFLSPMRDVKDKGCQVSLALPYGKTFAEHVVPAKGKIASGLDVSSNQVFLSKDPTSDRRHTIYIAYVDPLSIPAGPTPLLDCKPRDIWKPAPFGLDERGNRVDILLLWISILVGAQPRKGKTFSARLLALYAALDPYVKLFIVDGKNSPDWRKFVLVADMMIYGSHPSRDGDPVDQLLWTLRAIKKHIQKVNEVLSTLPVDVCPEGKLTRALARDPRYPDLRVWLLVMEEFQIYYELDDKEANAEVASLLSFIMAVGPSAGVILIGASQKPSGIGAGDIQRLFNRFRDNFASRFALKCGNRIVSDAILGGDAYAEGYDASSLPVGKEYLGVGYLYGLTDHTPTVRTYLAEHPDAEKILLAARRHREAAGTLSGMAAGEDVARQVRDVLADARSVFYAGEAWISWKQLAARMAEQMPEHYADLTQEAISAQLRAFKVAPKKGKFEGASLWGVPLDGLEQAAKRREIEAGP
jgi:S-DNA-T family DNA segregation ATPase FtsK/SpoIIIE